ncbi:hypothetical protein GCM10027184_61210 [Saccharothrix stipae]
MHLVDAGDLLVDPVQFGLELFELGDELVELGRHGRTSDDFPICGDACDAGERDSYSQADRLLRARLGEKPDG